MGGHPQCFFWWNHRWTRWGDVYYEVQRFFFGHPLSPKRIQRRQERTCEKCGKRQER